MKDYFTNDHTNTKPIGIKNKKTDTHIAIWMNLHNVKDMNTENNELE